MKYPFHSCTFGIFYIWFQYTLLDYNVESESSLWTYHQARKALRALKGLVKLQALVRGYLVRKRAAATLYSMQALLRAQTAARSQRARRSFKKDNKLYPEFNPRKSIVRFNNNSTLRFNFPYFSVIELVIIMFTGKIRWNKKWIP